MKRSLPYHLSFRWTNQTTLIIKQVWTMQRCYAISNVIAPPVVNDWKVEDQKFILSTETIYIKPSESISA